MQASGWGGERVYHGREQRRACARASAYPAAQYDWNSLIAASDSGHDKAVALLLDRGAKITATNEVLCARHGFVGVLRQAHRSTLHALGPAARPRQRGGLHLCPRGRRRVASGGGVRFAQPCGASRDPQSDHPCCQIWRQEQNSGLAVFPSPPSPPPSPPLTANSSRREGRVKERGAPRRGTTDGVRAGGGSSRVSAESRSATTQRHRQTGFERGGVPAG